MEEVAQVCGGFFTCKERFPHCEVVVPKVFLAEG